jgi:hypothetical protein
MTWMQILGRSTFVSCRSEAVDVEFGFYGVKVRGGLAAAAA